MRFTAKRSKRWWTALFAAAVLSTSSTTLSAAPGLGVASAVPPTAIARVRGRVLDSGGPADGVQVAIFRNRETSFCFLGVTDCDDIQLASTVTRAGAFELAVPRPRSAPKGFRISATRPPSPGATAGPRSRLDLKTLADDQTVPDIVVWDRRPSVTEDRGLLRAAIIPPPGGSDRFLTEFVAKDTASTRIPSFDATADARLFEDRPIVVSSSFGGAQSEVTPFQGKLVPPSRGRPCTPAPAANPVTPCPMTDGSYTSYDGPRLRDERFKLRSPIFTIDLGAPMEVGLIVAAGCSRDCVVSTSADAATWLILETEAEPPVSAYAPPAPVVTRFVRVEGDVPAEVSVWPPATGGKGQPVVGLLPEEAAVGGDTPRLPVVLAAAVAALLLFGVLLASVAVAWRRRLR